jgi:hypothetical protein
MILMDMRPELTPWRDHRRRKIGHWTFVDGLRLPTEPPHEMFKVRYIYHYDTLMGYFYLQPHDWQFQPMSIGEGSWSDQMGMNKLLAPRYHVGRRKVLDSYGMRYSRNAPLGARYETPAGEVIL